MSKAISDESPSLWAEQWAIQASVEADRIQHQMEVAKAAEPLDARREAAARAIEELLGSVRHATQQRGRWWRYRGPFDRWRGTSVERAYQSLHAARVFLVELLSDESVEALVPNVVANGATILKSDDPRRVQIDLLPHLQPGPARRAALQQAMELTFDASDQLQCAGA